MEEVARVITQAMDHTRYDQCSENNQPEIVENSFPEVKVDFGSCNSYDASDRTPAAGIDHEMLQKAQGP
jgi:hypothetical protein